ncbi:HAD family hydrolase [Enterococcus asini]|uniref:HAD family hydrolase n=1 Tax=Enterococcus asini TaxID=57732 RepID=UPI00289214C5|nr:HAD family hydrolase [Enterococcus asini]MDT2757203.1 HAD family hydrolase [Enterococcus asini]
MRRKLIAFDIDGTLLDSKKAPLASTIDALDHLRKEGHLVTIATGRSRYMAQDIIRELNFENYIVCNGAAAFLNHNQIFKNLLDKQELDRLVSEANQLGIDTAFIEMDQARRMTSFNVGKMAQAMMSFGTVLPDLEPMFPESQEIYQALAFFSEAYQSQFESRFPSFDFVRWHEECVDVVPKNSSKAATIGYLAQRLEIDQADIVAFGDGNNDREMLRLAGTGIVMGNATPEVQACGDLVTDSNDEDGIWKALKTLDLI